jgi:hypothetical protein
VRAALRHSRDNGFRNRLERCVRIDP